MKGLRKVTPYTPGEQPDTPGMIKLNTNENPFPPSPAVAEAMKNINTDKLKLYSPHTFTALKESIALQYGITPDMVFPGNSSDDVLAHCFMAFFNSDSPIVFPDLTYSFYKVWCGLFNIPYKQIPLNGAFRMNKEDYAVENGGVVIANPNAPTGIYENLDFIEYILQKNPDYAVIVDEAYIDFGGESSVKLLGKYKNLVVVHTFSKSRSLAGLRIGYAMASAELVNLLEAIKHSFNSYPIGSIPLELALAASMDVSYYKQINAQIVKNRELLTGLLDKMGFSTLPSQANFVFTTRANTDAKSLFEHLKAKNIYVRYFDTPRIKDYLRITVGTEEEIKKLAAAIEEYIAQ